VSDTTTTTAVATEAPREWTAQDAEDLAFGVATDQDAEPWKANVVGKQLHGLLRSVDDFTSTFSGEKTLRIIVEDKAGVRWSIIPPAQLRRLFTERWLAGAVDIGKPIAIVYDGDKELKNGRGKMKLFRVLPEPGEAVARARAANSVAAVVRAASRQPGDDFEDDDPAESAKKKLDFIG
jgi:hypothetical protein